MSSYKIYSNTGQHFLSCHVLNYYYLSLIRVFVKLCVVGAVQV